jgi:hypothetical protein
MAHAAAQAGHAGCDALDVGAWGTTWPLCRVERLACKEGWRVGFWSAAWTPWPILAMCRLKWLTLRFAVRVRYATD